MFKPLTLVALMGALGSTGFAGQLKAGVALPPDLVPAVAAAPLYGEEGAGATIGSPAFTPWGEAAAQLFTVGHKRHARRGREGGEGGEGGEGRKGRHQHRHYRYHFHDYDRDHRFDRDHRRYRGHRHDPHWSDHSALPPAYGAAPGVALPCGARELAGTLLGAATGGFLGAQIGGGSGQLAAVAAGTVLGAFLGHEIGYSFDQADLACAQYAAEQAYRAPVGTDIRWENPETGHYGTVTPTREGLDVATGRYCREYQTTVSVGGRSERAYGTACRQPDGSWEIIG